VLSTPQARIGAISKITSGRERFAIALMDAMESMLDRGLLHTSATDRSVTLLFVFWFIAPTAL
jgi:hypothetical protein